MPITVASIREPLPPGALRAALQPDGTVLVYMAGDTLPPVPAPSLDDIRAARIEAINAECRGRLIARFGPAEEQVSRSIGVYGQAERDALAAGIGAMIDASNAASNAILAAQSAAAVEAVTVTWPAI